MVRLDQHCFLETLGHDYSLFSEAAGQADQEFVLAAAAENVVAAKVALQALGKFAENGISGSVTALNVDFGEFVEIDQHEGKRGSQTLRAIGFLKEQAHHGLAIEQSGQIVVRSEKAHGVHLGLKLTVEMLDSLRSPETHEKVKLVDRF